MGKRTAYGVRSIIVAIACLGALACGDDDAPVDAGTDSEVSAGGRGGRGGGTGGRGGRGGTGGRAPTGGRGPTGGTGMMMTQCTEPAPTQPVVCGGETCEAPTYMGNTCVVACCATVGGAQVCGAKSTNPSYTTDCEPPVVADPACPDVDAQGTPLEGCCDAAQGVCGIISTLRPGCITMSSLIELPENPQACGASSGDDAGMDDAGR